MPKKAIIIGAGPAGLTAAYELLKRTDIIPIVLEKSGEIGGISRTTNYKGNRMDMGPHRFFSKSDRVMDWWLKMMPLEDSAKQGATISYQNKTREIADQQETATSSDKRMLVIQRLTRIYFLRQFFAYPIQLTLDTLKTLGFIRTIRIMISFLYIRLFPRKPEKSLEDFIINKFGRELYLLFFKDYTEKVWGIAPSQISAEWGAQRIKGVSLSKAIAGAIKSLKKKKSGDISQKETETSLIEQFLYPKYGPGSLWEEVAHKVQAMGGKVYLQQDVQKIYTHEGKIQSVVTVNSQTGQTGAWDGDYFFSTMPVQELIADLGSEVPAEIQEIAAGLQYRDFINVGVLLKKLSTKEGRTLDLKDNWIYIQEKDVKVGRLMIYNNWGSGMIRDPKTTWIGMEYFCNKTDDLWAMNDLSIQALAIKELEKMDLARTEDVLDSTVRRMEKTYPAYFGTYERFDEIKTYINKFENLFLVGRNGMHKYNNADHSMLTAMVAVDNIEAGITTKDNLWSINTEQEYHEEKKGEEQGASSAVNSPGLSKKKPALVLNEFKSYLFENPQNRALLAFAGLALIVQFIVFKLLYPFASFINGDSYVYLGSAFMNDDINNYPVGYPHFLRLFSAFTKSDTALVATQYLLMQLSSLGLIFTLFFFYQPRKWVRLLTYAFVVFNPVFLYVANFVSSDAIFYTLSIVWFTLLMWILYKPIWRLVILQAVVLFFAFTVRYNALYYPIVAQAVFLLTKQPAVRKIAYTALTFLGVGLFVLFTSNAYKQLTGIRQFTPFSGWQLANNAMYAYRYVDSAHRVPVPANLKGIDQEVRHYFDTSRNIQTHPVENLVASTVYMWDPHSPLNSYMKQLYKKDSFPQNDLKKWASMAPLYAEYGQFIIKKYPGTFLKFYILPNALKFYAPPGEFLDVYNTDKDSVAPIAQAWFGYKSLKVHTAFKDFKIKVLRFLPIWSAIMNLFFLISLVGIAFMKGFDRKSLLSKIVLLALFFWTCNFGFSVFSAPITLRYQIIQIVVFTAFALIQLDNIVQLGFPSRSKTSLELKENNFVAQ